MVFRRGARAGILGFILAGGLAAAASAQEPPAGTPVAPAALVVLNRTVVEFRGMFMGIPPAERAAAAEERIAAELRRGGAAAVTTVAIADNVVVQMNGRLAFVVTPGDASPLLEETPADVARAAVAVLERLVRESQESRDTRMRLRAAGLAVAYVAALVLGVIFLARLRRLIADRVAAFAETRATRFTVGGAAVVSGGHARRLAGRLLGALYGITVFMAAYEVLGLILREFPYTRAWGEELDEFLITLVQSVLTGVAKAAPGLLVVGAIIVIARLVNGAGRVFFDRVREQKLVVNWLDADLTAPTQRLFTIIVWLFALVMAYPYLPGSGSAAFDGLSVLVGLMVSLGGASAVGQAISGLILMYARTFRVGDYVRIDDIEGTVTSLTMVQTRLRTGMGDEIVVANSRIVGALVRNYSRTASGQGMMVDAAVTIGYDAPWRQVHDLLLQAARSTTGIAGAPPPRVFQTALSDFYVEYRLVCQTAAEGPALRATVMSDLHANIQDAFNAADVQIMSPHYFADPAAPKVVPKEKWHPGRRA